MDKNKLEPAKSAIDRRDFLRYSAVAGTGVLFAPTIFAQTGTSKAKEVNIALIGAGRQGKILLEYLIKIPGVQMRAVTDIWSYSQTIAERRCASYNHTVNVYEDYRKMLDTEKGLDAVVIATPDFVHAEMTNACLESGLHVYCEKEMSNDIEQARSMVQTAAKTGKLLQIGHQRRSNPFYKHAYNLMHKDKIFGDIHTVQAQWNQKKPLAPLPKKLASKYPIAPAVLAQWGYKNMQEFYDWRWFNKYAGGPMTDLGSHQVDIFCWYLNAPPTSVYSIGGVGYAKAEAKAKGLSFVPECFDSTLSLYEWKLQGRTVRGFYMVNLLGSYGGFFEVFMGEKGSMVISEIKEKHAMFKERTADALEWEDEAEMLEVGGEMAMKFDPLKSRKAKGKMDAEGLALEQDMDKPAHQPHLENFVAAIREGAKLTCPAEVGFETCVAVIKANDSAVTGKRLRFQPAEFKA